MIKAVLTGFLPTYEELKRRSCRLGNSRIRRFLPTYEELKLDNRARVLRRGRQFFAYL